jgi:hypothetical protein
MHMHIYIYIYLYIYMFIYMYIYVYIYIYIYIYTYIHNYLYIYLYVYIKALVKTFIKVGPKIKDPIALQALSVSLAKLSTDNRYMVMLEKHHMLNPLTEQLFILMEICKVKHR